MAYEAKVLLDSVNEAGDRLVTMCVTYPRFVHSEFMTHRMFSRNAASSRAIPVQKMIERVMQDPVLPVEWGQNQKGMQAITLLDEIAQREAEVAWLEGRDAAVLAATKLQELRTHKQIVNRLLEPWMWITVIVSATEWDNFFKLRCHPDAQPELRHIAVMMRIALVESKPVLALAGGWHTPLLQPDDTAPDWDYVVKLSAGRCARISHLTHDGRRDPAEDIRLHDDLVRDEHWSPLEHQAQAAPGVKSGNFTGWVQYRQMVEQEQEQEQEKGRV
jgi:hypothetical protein